MGLSMNLGNPQKLSMSAILIYRLAFSSIDSFSVLSIDFLFYRKLFCSINMANVFEFLSKDGNITP